MQINRCHILSLALIWLMMSNCFCLGGCAVEKPPTLEQSLDYGFPNNFDQQVTSDAQVEIDMEANDLDLNETWPEFTGYWRIEHYTTLRSELPVILEEVETVIQATLVAEITQEGQNLWLHHKICDVHMANTPAYNQTIIPDSFIDALPIQTRTAQLSIEDPVGEGEIKEEQFRFLAPLWYDLRSVVLDQPSQDGLPNEASDPRVYDQDLDGIPGLSATLVGFPDGEVSLIQKSWDQWDGMVETERLSNGGLKVVEVNGFIDWGQEQKIISASNEVLLIDVNRWIPEEVELHYFSILPTDTLTCPARRAAPQPAQ